MPLGIYLYSVTKWIWLQVEDLFNMWRVARKEGSSESEALIPCLEPSQTITWSEPTKHGMITPSITRITPQLHFNSYLRLSHWYGLPIGQSDIELSLHVRSALGCSGCSPERTYVAPLARENIPVGTIIFSHISHPQSLKKRISISTILLFNQFNPTTSHTPTNKSSLKKALNS